MNLREILKSLRKRKNEIVDLKGRNQMVSEEEVTFTNRELQEEIKQLKKRIKDLERERDILLALHRRDTDWTK
jgi:protein subunit release factor A